MTHLVLCLLGPPTSLCSWRGPSDSVSPVVGPEGLRGWDTASPFRYVVSVVNPEPPRAFLELTRLLRYISLSLVQDGVVCLEFCSFACLKDWQFLDMALFLLSKPYGADTMKNYVRHKKSHINNNST